MSSASAHTIGPGYSEHRFQRGNRSENVLIQQLSWGGKIFGAFVDAEVRRLRTWMECLPVSDYLGRTRLIKHIGDILDERVVNG